MLSGEVARAQDRPFAERSVADLAPALDAAEADARAGLVRLRKAEAEGLGDEETAERSLALLKAEARYRAAISWDLQLRLLAAPEDERISIASSAYRRANTERDLADASSAVRLHEYLKKTPGFIERATGLGPSGLDTAVKARVEAQLRLLRIRESAAHEVLTAISPVICIDRHRMSPDELVRMFRGRCTSRTIYRLAGLARRIGSSFPQGYVPNELESDAGLLSRGLVGDMAAIRNHLDMEEFRRVALTGLVVDPQTRAPVSGILRIRVAENAEKSLTQYLNRSGKRGDYTKLWSGEPLRDLGRSITAEIKTRPDYKLLQYIEVGEAPSPREFFLVAARVIRAEQEAMLKAYNEGYLGGSFDQVDLEQLLRVSNAWGTGDASIQQVKRRLDLFMADMDAAHDALMNARNMPPAALAKRKPQHYRLLRDMGYVDGPEGDPAKGRYVIPETQSGFRAFAERARGGVDLPGKGTLSVVNLRNAFQAAVSVVVPELAAARLAAIGRNITLTERGMAAARLAGEAAAGTALDASLEALFKWRDARPGEEVKGVAWDRLILESVVLGSALQFTGGAVDASFTSALKTLGSETPKSALYKAIKGNPRAARRIEAYARTALGLASDTALTTFFQMYVQGHMDPAAWHAVLMNSALSRAVATAATQIRAPRATWQQLKGFIPEQLRPAFDANPRLREEVLANVNQQLAREREIREKFIGTVEPAVVTGKRLFADLASGNLNWRDLTKVIYPKLKDKIQHAMEDLRDMREIYFFTMEREAKRRAVDDINKTFNFLVEKANREASDREAALASIERLEAARERELRLVREEIIAPGSKDPTSDIDRSSQSAWVRRHLRALYESRGRYRADGDVPTSARAFDVNEYINVFPFITENSRYLSAMRGQRVTDGPGGLSHGMAMEALSLAAAMRHMTPSARERFLENRRKALTRRVNARELLPSELRRFESQIAYARHSMESSDHAFQEVRKEVAARNPGRSETEIDVLATDALYDRRMQDVNDLQFELSQMESQDSGPALALRARIERLMSVALRDGIETYSSPTGLDIVVNRVQQAKVTGPDGETRGMKVADRLKDPSFTLEGELAAYSERDAASVINDQVMFIAEHVHAFSSGHESFYETGRALGKYIERAFLGMKIAGLDIAAVRKRPPSDPHRRLLEASELLIENKSDPEALVAALTSFSRAVPRSPEAGMAEIFWLIEKVFPGMEGLTGVLAREEPAKARSPEEARRLDPRYRRMRMVVERRWQRELTLVRGAGGPDRAVALVKAELARATAALRHIDQRLTALAALGRDYLTRDWKEVIRLQNAAYDYRVMVANLPDPRNPLLEALSNGQEAAESRLAALRSARGAPDNLQQKLYQNVPEYRRLSNRKAYLLDRIQWLRDDLKAEMAHAEKVARLAKLNLSGRWTCEADGIADISLQVSDGGDRLTMVMALPGPAAQRIDLEARRLWGEIAGIWRTRSVDGTGPAGLASAYPTENGDEIQFTDRSTDDPGLALGWASVVCRRNGAGQPTKEPDAGFITMSVEAHGHGTDGYWDLKTIAPEGAVDAYGLGVGFKVRRGRRVFTNRALTPGRYDAAVTVGTQVFRRPLVITGGATTWVTVRPAAIGVMGVDERDRTRIEAKLHPAGRRQTMLEVLFPGQWTLVPPGSYDLELVTDLGSVWIEGLDLAVGQALELEAKTRMASFIVTDNPAMRSVSVRRAAVEGASGDYWWRAGDLGPVPPGEYEVMWFEGSKRRNMKVTLHAGEEKLLVLE